MIYCRKDSYEVIFSCMDEFSPCGEIIPGRNLAEPFLMLNMLYSHFEKRILLEPQHLPQGGYKLHKGNH